MKLFAGIAWGITMLIWVMSAALYHRPYESAVAVISLFLTIGYILSWLREATQ